MFKTFIGYCPTQDKEYSIVVEYLDTSDLNQRSYCKGRASCNFNRHGDKCDASKCPILKSAPQNL